MDHLDSRPSLAPWHGHCPSETPSRSFGSLRNLRLVGVLEISNRRLAHDRTALSRWILWTATVLAGVLSWLPASAQQCPAPPLFDMTGPSCDGARAGSACTCSECVTWEPTPGASWYQVTRCREGTTDCKVVGDTRLPDADTLGFTAHPSYITARGTMWCVGWEKQLPRPGIAYRYTIKGCVDGATGARCSAQPSAPVRYVGAPYLCIEGGIEVPCMPRIVGASPGATGRNTDGDGQVDALDPDDDNDGKLDGADNCPRDSNPGQWNNDHDFWGDPCDNCPRTATTSQADTDADGVGDACDICVTVSNSDQADRDGDGIGDACDGCPDWKSPDRNHDGQADACQPLRVDFGPADSLTPPGFVRDAGVLFEPALGYGWDLAVPTRDRASEISSELNTFVFSHATRRFTAEVANGDYELFLVSGDASFAQGPHRVESGGQLLVNDVSTVAGGFTAGFGRFTVRNQRIDIRIGGSSGSTMLNLIELVRVAGPHEPLRTINFQPAGSIVPAEAEPDTGALFTAARGYGWNRAVTTVERGARVPQSVDTLALVTEPATWELDLPSGFYEVGLSLGDPSYTIGQQFVRVEGRVVAANVTTPPAQFLERATAVRVFDGRLTVEVGVAGGKTALDWITVYPLAADADGDGLPNESDNCPFDANAPQYDRDEDGSGDTCDDDDDGDGWPDVADNCSVSNNPNQGDRDGDGIGDDCDRCIGASDPAQIDRDADGVGDACDNCPLAVDPTQSDVDGDAIGDVCDDCPELFDPSQSDLDHDGVGDVCDNCLHDPNAGQSDRDHDGIGDSCDGCVVDSDEAQSDRDRDGEGDRCDNDDGSIVGYFSTPDRYEWQAEPGATSWHLYRGNLAVLRTDGVYTQAQGSNPLALDVCHSPQPFYLDTLRPVRGAVAYYLVTSRVNGVEGSLGTNSAGQPRVNANPCP